MDRHKNQDSGDTFSIDDDRSCFIIGRRGANVISPTVPYMMGYKEFMQDPCDPETNAEGYIALCLTENHLIQELLAYRLMRPEMSLKAFGNSIVYNYSSFLGLAPAREAVAYFLESRFLKSRDGRPLMREQDGFKEQQKRVHPNHIVLGSGCGSLLNSLFFTLAEYGDAVLIPSPYYVKFEIDMKTIAGCVPYPIYCTNPEKGPSVEDLEFAAHQAEKAGHIVKILLLNNPNNPLGVIYQPNVILKAVKWARSRKNCHVIMNEIYALSIHKKDALFYSTIEILQNKLGNHVHFIYSFSKDFGAGGFRLGILYTQNESLLTSLEKLNAFSCVSHPIQMVLTEILSDNYFLDSLIVENKRLLRMSYEVCTKKLREMVVPYISASAGCCVYVDFSSLLPEMSWDGEDQFALLVQTVAKVIMTPGRSMRDNTPGMFRICFACVTPEVLDIAMERLSVLVRKIRKIGWDNLTDVTCLNEFSKVIHFSTIQSGIRRIDSLETKFDITKLISRKNLS